MRLKKIIFGLIALGGTAALYADEPGIAVIDTQGNRIEIAYTQLDRISLTVDGVQLVEQQPAGTPQTVAYADLDRIMIGAQVNAVSKVTDDTALAVWPTVTDGLLYVKSIDDRTVSITSMSGAQVVKTSVEAGSIATLDLSSLTAGVYLVKCGDNTIKIIKK